MKIQSIFRIIIEENVENINYLQVESSNLR